MRGGIAIGRIVAGAPGALAIALLAGCAAEPTPSVPIAPTAPPSIVVAPVPVPHETKRSAPPAPTKPAVHRAAIAVLFDDTAPSSAAVAAALGRTLPASRYRVTRVPIDGAPLGEAGAGAAAIVAVGLKAAQAARAELPDEPLVFCEVYGYETLLAEGRRVWGVEPLPPLALQLDSWKRVDPALRTIALISGDSKPGLVAEAQRAAAAAGAELRIAPSSSDRETLYLFKRLAAEIDGLWLFPDNRVLSPSVLRDMLAYAAAHGVAVFTFNDALLAWGALLSASAQPADVAATVAKVLDSVVAGRTDDLPPLTPLTQIRVHVNREVAETLGLSTITVNHGEE